VAHGAVDVHGAALAAPCRFGDTTHQVNAARWLSSLST
jgi:hypothetical protein